MTLQEFMELKQDCEVTVYYHNSPIYSWFDNDPRYKWKVLGFGIVNETEMWVDIEGSENNE